MTFYSNYLMSISRNRMNNTKSVLVTLLLISMMFLVYFSHNIESYAIIDEVEVREYEGEDLSSIDDFRENSIKGPQYVDVKNYRLLLDGLVGNVAEFEYDDILNSFESVKKVVTLHCVEGWSVNILWEGVLLEDMFEVVNIRSGANVVIFHAYDGYTTSLPLEYILEKKIIIAYKMNNITLPPERGFPFQLVAESKYGYKWIKWITKIELSNDSEYLGYWESRGYSNDAELSSGRPAPTTDFGSLPSFTPKPTPTATPKPIPSPIQTPIPSIEPSNTPDQPEPPLDSEKDLSTEITAGILTIAVVIILIFILKRR